MTRTYQKALTSSGTLKSIIENIIKKLIGEIHTTSIGVIEKFDPETQLATIQPAINYLDYFDKGKEYTLTDTKYPLLVNVPVIFPGGGDWHLTFPVKKGDECILMYTERSIGNWKKFGGVGDQSSLGRRHSMQDAIAIVGVNSKVNPLPQFNDTEPELRNRDGDIKLTMSSTGMTLTGDLVVTGSIDVAGGNWTVDKS